MTVSSVRWVAGESYSICSKNGNTYYHIVAVDENFDRFRIICGIEKKERIIHFLKAMDNGVSKKIPIFPKDNGEIWKIDLDLVDQQPPASSNKEKISKQLAISHVKPNGDMQKQSFVVSRSCAQKLTALAEKRGVTKSCLLADIVSTYVNSLETVNALF